MKGEERRGYEERGGKEEGGEGMYRDEERRG